GPWAGTGLYDRGRSCGLVSRGLSLGNLEPEGRVLLHSVPNRVQAVKKNRWRMKILQRFQNGGGRRTRTFEVIRRLIYSQLPLPLGTLPRSNPIKPDPPQRRRNGLWMT